jgi:hypothetical protein
MQCIKLNGLILYYFYTYIFEFLLYFSYLNGYVECQICCRQSTRNGLPINTYISLYATANSCYNEQVSRSNYFCSSIIHCI